MAPRQRLDPRAKFQQLERELHEAKAATASVTLPTFCSDWEAVFANPTIIPRPSAIGPTNPRAAENRYFPAEVVPWRTFEADVQRAFRKLSARIKAANNGSEAVFPAEIEYGNMGRHFVRSFKIRNEASTTRYEGRAIHEPVNVIFASINEELEFQLQSESGKHPMENAHGKPPQWQQQQQQQQQNDENAKPPQSGGLHAVMMECKTPTRPRSSKNAATEDQRRIIDAMVMLGGEPVALEETKASDKLTKLLLQKLRLPIKMQDVQDYCDEDVVKANDEERRATAAVAFVVVQAYDYMIRRRVRYAYITSLVAHLFMHFDQEDPNTLYLYCRANDDAAQRRTRQFKAIDHAVSSVASFIYIAANAPRLPPDWRPPPAVSQWKLDVAAFDHLATPFTAATIAETAEGSLYVNESPVSEDSPTVRRKPKKRGKNVTTNTCASEAGGFTNTRDSDDDDNDDDDDVEDNQKGPKRRRPNPKGTDSSAEAPSTRTGKGSTRNQEDSSKGRVSKRSTGWPMDAAAAFCTQRCLLGLVRGLPLDPACPNVLSHVPSKQGHVDFACARHELNAVEMLRRFSRQVNQGRRHRGLESTERCGSAGALFKATLASHGYRFVGKGTVAPLVPTIFREGLLYQHMAHLQGTAIPVHLGNLDLAVAWLLAPRVHIVHVMFLAYGGEEAWRVRGLDAARLGREAARSVAEVRRAGVAHRDLWNKQNILWNVETQRAMIIDFENADLVQGSSANGVTTATPVAATLAAAAEPAAKQARTVLGERSASRSNFIPKTRPMTMKSGGKDAGKSTSAVSDVKKENNTVKSDRVREMSAV
jgi:hypothetical protein